MPNRQIINGEPYRYAYQGQEKDPETGKEAFQLRLWDGRIGRWLSPDPMGEFHSPYLGMGNNPIVLVDPDGGQTKKGLGGARCGPGFFKRLWTKIKDFAFYTFNPWTRPKEATGGTLDKGGIWNDPVSAIGGIGSAPLVPFNIKNKLLDLDIQLPIPQPPNVRGNFTLGGGNINEITGDLNSITPTEFTNQDRRILRRVVLDLQRDPSLNITISYSTRDDLINNRFITVGGERVKGYGGASDVVKNNVRRSVNQINSSRHQALVRYLMNRGINGNRIRRVDFMQRSVVNLFYSR